MSSSTSVRLKSFPLQNPSLLCVTAVILRGRQLGTEKTLLGPCLLLLTQSANNMLTYSHEVLPVLCCSSCAYVICPNPTLPVTQIQVYVDKLFMHVSTHKHKLNTFHFPRCFYLLPISSASQGREKPEEAELLLSLSTGCFLS